MGSRISTSFWWLRARVSACRSAWPGYPRTVLCCLGFSATGSGVSMRLMWIVRANVHLWTVSWTLFYGRYEAQAPTPSRRPRVSVFIDLLDVFPLGHLFCHSFLDFCVIAII